MKPNNSGAADHQNSIALLGDIALNGLFCDDKHHNHQRLLEISSVLHNYNLVIANLETPVISENGTMNTQKMNGRGVLRYTESDVLKYALKALNVSMVSLANNHVYDCGVEGLKATTACLDAAGILHTGAGLSKSDISPVYFDLHGVRIGLIAYVERSTNPRIPDESGILVNYYDLQKIVSDIDYTKRQCDILVLSLHWGPDYSSFPHRYQVESAKKFILAGADIIFGHHSHTVQPHECYAGGVVFYSLGSLCYGDFWENGSQRALRLKTKRGYVPVLNPKLNIIREIYTKELKGNKVIINRKRSNSLQLLLMKIVHKYSFAYKLLLFKEIIIDRLVDYLFGYYRNPFKQLFSFSNLRKISFIKQDLLRGKRHR